MTRPVSYACEPSARYCECGHCQLPPARNIDLSAQRGVHRSYSATAYFLILLAALCAFYAIAFVKTEAIHTDIIKGRTV